MKVINVSSLGFKNLTKSVPETNKEYDNLAKRGPNAACEDAVASTLYRVTFPQFRPNFLERIEELTGISRKTRETDKKDEDGNPITVWDETEGTYWKRVKAEVGLTDEEAEAEYGAIAQEEMNKATFDPTIRERAAAGPKNVSKIYTKIATSAMASGKGAELAALLVKKLGHEVTLTGDTEADTKILATAIAENEANKRAKLKAEYNV